MTGNKPPGASTRGRPAAARMQRRTAEAGNIGACIPPWLKVALVLIIALLLLTFLYLAAALNVPYEADHAAMMVMGQAMLEGNPLLKGWTLGNQAYYTTELPFYAAGIWLMGFTWKVMYVVTGLHWAMLTILILLLGLPRRWQEASLLKVFIVFSLTLFLPTLLVNTLYLSNAHLVGFFYCLVCLLSIRNLEQGATWQSLVVFTVFLTLAVTGDTFGLFLLVAPVILICVLRILANGPQRQPVALLIATLASVILSKAALALTTMMGGALIPGPPTAFQQFALLENNLSLTAQGILELFAVEIFGQPVISLASAIGLVHLSGLILCAAAVYHYARRMGTETWLTQLLVAIVLFNIVENLLSSAVRPGTTRYLSPILIFGIPLVGRFVLESEIFKTRRGLVLAYFMLLAVSLIPPLTLSKPVSQSDGLARLLVQEDLQNGYGPYWRSNSTTVATAGQVTVRPVLLQDGRDIVPCRCFSADSWYDSPANFLVVQTDDSSGLQPSVEQASTVFGDPREKYSLGKDGYLLVWDHDITPFLTIP